MIMFYHCYSCIDLPVALVYFKVEVCPLLLYHVCQVDYATLNYIGFDGGERQIFVVLLMTLGWGESQRNLIR